MAAPADKREHAVTSAKIETLRLHPSSAGPRRDCEQNVAKQRNLFALSVLHAATMPSRRRGSATGLNMLQTGRTQARTDSPLDGFCHSAWRVGAISEAHCAIHASPNSPTASNCRAPNLAHERDLFGQERFDDRDSPSKQVRVEGPDVASLIPATRTAPFV
jgi:hypothetical protein